MFVREDLLAKAVSASMNTDIKVDMADGEIIISKSVRNDARRLYDEDYTDCVGVRVIFAEDVDKYTTDATVVRTDENSIYVSLDKTVTIKQGENDGINIKGINLPSDIKVKKDSATIKFKDGGMMCVRIKGDVTTTSKGWKIEKDNGDTVFTKFGKADKLTVKTNGER